jgi:hypothetical protein
VRDIVGLCSGMQPCISRGRPPSARGQSFAPRLTGIAFRRVWTSETLRRMVRRRSGVVCRRLRHAGDRSSPLRIAVLRANLSAIHGRAGSVREPRVVRRAVADRLRSSPKRWAHRQVAPTQVVCPRGFQVAGWLVALCVHISFDIDINTIVVPGRAGFHPSTSVSLTSFIPP